MPSAGRNGLVKKSKFWLLKRRPILSETGIGDNKPAFIYRAGKKGRVIGSVDTGYEEQIDLGLPKKSRGPYQSVRLTR